MRALVSLLLGLLAACGADGPPVPPSEARGATAPPLPVDAVEEDERTVDGLVTFEDRPSGTLTPTRF